MRVILTGSTGFVGTHLKRHLQEIGWTIEAIGRADDARSMDHKMKNFRPDVVIHLATLFIAEHKTENVVDLVDSNIRFGTELVESMVRNDVQAFVNTGTLWQYYENQRNVPSSLYSATKSAFEAILRFYTSAFPLKVINLMLSDTFGAKDARPKLLPKLISIAGTEEKLQLSEGQQKVEWTFISDIVKAFEVAALRLHQKQEPLAVANYTATSNEPLTLRKTVQICEKVLGKKIQVEFGAKPYRQREIMEPSKLDPQLPGWQPQVSFAQGIEACR